MKTLHRVVAALGIAASLSIGFGTGSARADEAPLLSLDVMRKATLGTYKGSFVDCGANESIELQLKEAKGDDQSLFLEGTLKTTDLSGGATSPQIDAEVRGTQLADTGYVSVSPKPRPVQAPSTAPGANVLGFFKQQLGIKDAPKTPPISFEGGFIRDFEGTGFVGVLESRQFKCHSFTMKRTDGSRSDGVPRPSADFIFGQAALATKFIDEEKPFDGTATGYPASRRAENGKFEDAPWLLYAARLGNVKALAYLGRIHEFGLGVPLDYDAALRYYTQAAEQNIAMAQLGLARLYIHGFGVERDPARSRQYSAQYGATRLAALRLCTDPKVLSTVTKMITAGMREPPPMTIGTALSAAMTPNTKIDLGSSFVYEKVAAVDLARIDDPFLCKFTVRAVDAKVTDMTPYREWSVRTPDGQIYYYNNKDEIEGAKSMADLTTLLANNMSALELFEVRATNAGTYRLSRMQTGMTGDLFPASATEVEVKPPR